MKAVPAVINGYGKDHETASLLAALEAARLSQWVYLADSGAVAPKPPIDRRVDAVLYIGNDQTDTQGAAIVTPDEVIFVMRGTEGLFSIAGLNDWRTNLKFKKTEFFGIRAHRGFAGAAMSVLADVGQVLDRFKDRQHIRFEGHSLGGGVSILLAVAIVHEFRRLGDPRRVSAITVGQPRVSRRRHLALALRFVPYLRVVNGSDAVPNVPKLGYSHAGTNLYIPNNRFNRGDAGKRVDVLWDPAWPRRFFDRLLTFGDRFRDHSTVDYINQLAKALR